MSDIGKRIKARREELGMTQAELAKKLGYKSKTTIGKIESCINDIPQSKVMSFAEALDTTPAQLMGWEQYDPHFSGREAPKEVCAKFLANIERHHRKSKELEEDYSRLSSDNQERVNSYAKKLYDIQQTNTDPTTIAAHFDGEEYTEEELNEIRQFAEFIKSKRRAAPPDRDEPEALDAANDRGATPEEKQNADDIMHNPDEWE